MGTGQSVQGALENANVGLHWDNTFTGSEVYASVWMEKVEGRLQLPGVRQLRFPLKDLYFETRWDLPTEVTVKKEKGPLLETHSTIQLVQGSSGDEKLRSVLRDLGPDRPVVCRGKQSSRWNNIYPGLVNFEGRTRVSAYVTLSVEVTLSYSEDTDSISAASSMTLQLTVKIHPDLRRRRQYAQFK
mmetsp:Transcript_55836/g.103338  ORF Transcript_55836/g.103338 Transcript_55836/m.103338 type:complete len:186 (-) Transcript_55836:203-760(-)